MYTITYSEDSTKKFEFACIDFGALIYAIRTPDKNGLLEDVTVQFQCLEDIVQHPAHPYFGANPGRVANRIANGSFSLDGQRHELAMNNGPNCLHGGVLGFDRRMWTCSCGFKEGPGSKGDRQQLELSYLSRHGEEGFPGNLQVTISYWVSRAGQLGIDYRATVTGSASPVNLTNHTYWNLRGDYFSRPPSVASHLLRLRCSKMLPVTSSQIPTGELLLVRRDGAFDFSAFRSLAAACQLQDPALSTLGMDHCLVVDNDPEGKDLKLVAELYEPESGRLLTLHSTQKGLQVYTGNFLGFSEAFPKWSAVCLEAQGFPDAINQAGFPSCILRPGEVYHQQIVHTFTVRL